TWPSSTPPSTPPPRSNNYSIPALSLGTCPQHLDIAGTSSTSTCRSICCYGISVGWSGRRSQHAVLMANPRPRGHGTPHTEPGVWGHALFIHSTAAGVFVAGLPRRATKDVLGWRCPTTAAISSLEAAPGCLNGYPSRRNKVPARLYIRDVYASTEMSSNVRCLGVITGKEIQPWLMEMMLDSHLHTGIDMPPQGTVIFRQQVTCVVVEAAVLATTAETINMATTDDLSNHGFPADLNKENQEAVNSPTRRALFPLDLMPYTKQLQHVQDRGPKVLQKLERGRGVQKPAGQQNVTKQSAPCDSLPAVRRLCSVRSSITNYTAREMQDTEMRVVRAGYSIGPK
ncbi:hypothetical protein PoMZ_10856, partial [Pyricularia oryzae]